MYIYIYIWCSMVVLGSAVEEEKKKRKDRSREVGSIYIWSEFLMTMS